MARYYGGLGTKDHEHGNLHFVERSAETCARLTGTDHKSATIRKHTPLVSWVTTQRHFMDTVKHARKLLTQRIRQRNVIPKVLSLLQAAEASSGCDGRASVQHYNHTPNMSPSRTGPKSGGGGGNRMRTLQFLCLFGAARGVRVAPEVRVGVTANIAPEATHHGRHPPSRDGEVVGQANHVNACPYTWSAKRAYRRARARAAANGTTTYRGRIHDQSSLQLIRGQAPPTVTVKRQRLTRQPNTMRHHLEHVRSLVSCLSGVHLLAGGAPIRIGCRTRTGDALERRHEVLHLRPLACSCSWHTKGGHKLRRSHLCAQAAGQCR